MKCVRWLGMVLFCLDAGAGTAEGGDLPKIDTQLLHPSWMSQDFVYIQQSAALEPGFQWDYWLAYTHGTLVYERFTTQELMAHVAQVNAFAGWARENTLLQMEVPVYLQSWGGQAPRELGFGDVRLGLLQHLWEKPTGSLAVSMSAYFGLPTSTMDGALGSKKTSAGGLFSVDGGSDTWGWSLNWGYEFVPDRELENFVFGPRVVLGLGASWSPRDDFGVAVEGMARTQANLNWAPGGTPVELMVSGWGHGRRGTWKVGLGGALHSGVGAAQVRSVLSYIPSRGFFSGPATPEFESDGTELDDGVETDSGE